MLKITNISTYSIEISDYTDFWFGSDMVYETLDEALEKAIIYCHVINTGKIPDRYLLDEAIFMTKKHFNII